MRARTVALHHDFVEVDPQLGGVLCRPEQSRVAVLDRVGVGELRRDPILNGDGDRVVLDDPRHDLTDPDQAVADDHART